MSLLAYTDFIKNIETQNHIKQIIFKPH